MRSNAPLRTALRTLGAALRSLAGGGATFATLLVVLATSGCQQSECSGVVVAGQCAPVCSDSDCAAGERCVANVCSPECERDSDCQDGGCRSVTTDYGGRGNYCLAESPGAETNDEPAPESGPPADAASPSAACTSNLDCADPNVQTHCIDQRCVVACLTHDHCLGTGACTGDALDVDGQPVTYCEPDGFERGPGQFGWQCLSGSAECDRDNDFRCSTRGEGDLDSYCSKMGCEADDDCPVGYYCNGDTFSALAPCGAACGLPADPLNPECVSADDIGAGRPFRCTDQGLELRTCRKRSFCGECTSDADCRGVANQVCASDGSGGKICTLLCEPEASSCPWGSATSCDVHDPTLWVPTCAHRYGSCRGAGESCAPCVEDSDCPAGFCSGSSFTGERFCLNLADSCQCPLGAATCLGGGCPTTPGGLTMNCVPTSETSPPSACFGAPVAPEDPAGQIGCWPAPPPLAP